ncbi:MAG: hypothetical protein A2487_06285 [Candidatus Raymondbacteria bacterium RifOxyC12_full_50_8]|uniref:Uncharacterized protein n=1 Tax=Candidatus Raymondbacteria bacterium RIFOXYD12_FULL_49_13 TaxID=1817890 RepID=A0A1F7FC92_UNCRA|nr:MAG: hypothetical protein A2248_03185 [Candidatus Raymondbacteria bacterium RIFOXYA2_FULL_49_16]OGJ93297.1 MAG: hypothetical protein A2350_14610 [Candidatus Raymondbacteria bacterium RifOxyB12_full_50_8]OGK04258.1 MAG: hypothetical protein A2519_18020 [Candidatus Raymondbacteria bacterium RIFOXYD12_FULL_49_13]OGK06056.1 MAG: hypothetical protein A2487_06285 [Candidatus Raymondbacteria bacterium RifOxyC12_full_50_8]OGP42459.1 MAG: hypothetical protein A2324_17220 [Candidatus Raymondbacteria b
MKVSRFFLCIGFAALAASMAFFVSCEKAVQPVNEGGYANQVQITVADTLLDTIAFGPDTFYNRKAYVVEFRKESATWDPDLIQSPAVFNLYKYYVKTRQNNLVCRVYGGGGGIIAGDTVYYTDSKGRVDTLTHHATVRVLVITGTEDKAQFQFEATALTNLSLRSSFFFSSGFENSPLRHAAVLGGGTVQSFSINSNDDYTVNNVATIRATFDTTGVSNLRYFRYSSTKFIPFATIFSLDSLLKNRVPAESVYVTVPGGYSLAVSDSTVLQAGISIGKFGGEVAFSIGNLQNHFSVTPVANDPGWISVEKTDTLVSGFGQKWAFLTSAKWSTPLYDNINIWSFNGAISLDQSRANIAINSVEKKIYLLDDYTPFLFDTFGDTSFAETVSVWIATRNLYNQFLLSGDGSFPTPITKATHNAVGYGGDWPDAILETPPINSILTTRGGIISDGFTPDYTANYRVSPLAHLYSAGAQLMQIQYADAKDIPTRKNSSYIHQMVTRGSILGHQESKLNDLSKPDSVYTEILSVLKKIPVANWFTFVPLEQVSPAATYNNTYSSEALQEYFSKADNAQLIPSTQPVANPTYYAIFSAYFYAPSPTISGKKYLYFPGRGGEKLFTNPFRAMPLHVAHCNSGSKEFVLIAYARGRFFNEPRVFISSFTSPYTYVWDYIPPHISWHENWSTSTTEYAPLYYLASSPADNRITDLSTTSMPNIFNVFLSSKPADQNADCSVRDVGFGKIISVRIGFNYSLEFQSLDPVTGMRTYQKPNMYYEIDPAVLARQAYNPHSNGFAVSYSLGNIAFYNINAQQWNRGIWDMWIETEDNLGNRGVAPYLSATNSFSIQSGSISVRQILIK